MLNRFSICKVQTSVVQTSVVLVFGNSFLPAEIHFQEGGE